MTCPWCKFNKSSCQGVEASCDFKSLPYEKGAIVMRIKQEYGKIQELKKSPNPDTLRDVVDKIAGIQVMSERLREDFGMAGQDIRREAGIEELGTIEKLKLGYKLKLMQRSRGGKPAERITGPTNNRR
jgi:hypothetical protein